jgi:HPt (histidine-containing phosphotransfer) domain-containing protein
MKVKSSGTHDPQGQLSFNRDTFLARLHNDLDQVLDLIELFLDICPDSLRRIKAAVEHRDAVAIRETAHQFKGSLEFIHAEPALAAAKRLEQMGRQRQLDEAVAAFDELSGRSELLGQELRAFLAACDR